MDQNPNATPDTQTPDTQTPDAQAADGIGRQDRPPTLEPAAAPGPPRRPRWLRRVVANLARDAAYLLPALPISLAAGIVVVVGLALGLSTVIVWVGLAIIPLTLTLAHWFAELELARLAADGRDLRPNRSQRVALRQAVRSERPFKPLRLALAPMANPTRWREAAHALASAVLSTITWSIALTLLLVAVAGLTAGIWHPITDSLGTQLSAQGPAEALGWRPIPTWAVDTAIGLVAAALAPPVLRGLTALHWALARALLAPGRSPARRVAELESARARASAAEAQSWRRIERDIHDGPQQQLVRLAMDLATAQRRLAAGDADAAGAVLAEARDRLGQAGAELRSIIRGIAPPILADRGLPAALAALAAGLAAPVRLRFEPPQPPRLPAAQETALYFAASELLANVAKHAQAASAELTLKVPPGAGQVELSVHDDGRGGAVVAPGHGLAGLADRLAGIDGSMTITSGPGGTVVVVKAALPPGAAGAPG
ncbi:MAG: sensor domain-containing protein [Bifidobacteriaceae bacterium]|jgi:signal transduction histidine kinase|nr:sensor domain-containing protein [Bifidobacteriaceae bacterium]